MNNDDVKNIKLYESLLKKYKKGFRTLNWGSSKSQIRRFKVLAEIGISSGDKVLDVGCGLADFYNWIKKNKLKIKYTGLDITPGMIKKSKKKFPKINFIQGTIDHLNIMSQNFDYIIASGIFVYIKNNPDKYMKKTISKMYSLSKKGIAFNSLSSFSLKKDKNEFYANPSDMFNFCKNLSSRVVLRHDYHDNDFTIYMYKDKRI